MHFRAHSATLNSVRQWASIHGLYVDYWPYSVVVVGIRRTETKETGFFEGTYERRKNIQIAVLYIFNSFTSGGRVLFYLQQQPQCL